MKLELDKSQQLAVRFGAWGTDGKLKYSNRVIAISSLSDASEKWECMRDEIGLGSSNSPIVVVVDVDTGEHVAKISYNGRVWGADGKEIPINERKTVARHDAEGWVDFKRRRVASCAC